MSPILLTKLFFPKVNTKPNIYLPSIKLQAAVSWPHKTLLASMLSFGSHNIMSCNASVINFRRLEPANWQNFLRFLSLGCDAVLSFLGALIWWFITPKFVTHHRIAGYSTIRTKYITTKIYNFIYIYTDDEKNVIKIHHAIILHFVASAFIIRLIIYGRWIV